MRSMALAGNIGCGLLTAAALGPAGRGEQTALGLAPLVLAAASTLGPACLAYLQHACRSAARITLLRCRPCHYVHDRTSGGGV